MKNFNRKAVVALGLSFTLLLSACGSLVTNPNGTDNATSSTCSKSTGSIVEDTTSTNIESGAKTTGLTTVVTETTVSTSMNVKETDTTTKTTTTSDEVPPENIRVVKGTFVQPWLTCEWNDKRWQKELSAMKELGMEYLVFAPIAHVDKDGKWYTIYPSAIPEISSGYAGADFVDAALRNCEEAGIKVFVGLNSNDKFWDYGWNTKNTKLDKFKTYMSGEAELGNKVADELYAKYKNKYKNAFYGWYWVTELWNMPIAVKTSDYRMNYINAITDAINVNLDHLTTLNDKMPIMLSPFANIGLCSSQENCEFWTDIVTNSRFRSGDIICPQDGIGAGGCDMDKLDEWTQSYKKAVDAKSGLHFWSNNESFNGKDYSSTPLRKFFKQVEITARYAEVNITFSYNHYYSPHYLTEGFQKAYKQYLKTHLLERNAPSAPTDLRTTKVGDTYTLRWSASQDDSGIYRYNIYNEKGKLEKAINIKKTSGGGRIYRIAHNLQSGTYYLEAVDVIGNASPRTQIKIG